MSSIKVNTLIQVGIYLSIFFWSLESQSQESMNSSVKQEVLNEMETFYNQMRAVDLDWMNYLSDDATAVHNGEFLDHDTFIHLEKEFFNSLKKLEITVLSKPLVYVLGYQAASVTQEHSVNTWYKTGQEFKDIKQMMTFIWHKRNGKWKIVHSSFTTKN